MSTRLIGIGVIFAAASLAPIAVAQAQEDRHGEGEAIDCMSRDHAHERCDVTWRDARLVRQLSDTRCVRGENWGIDRQGIWVDRGCSGRFVAVGGHDRDGERDREYGRADESAGWQPAPSWNRRFSVSCESQDGRDHFCQVDLGGGGRASLERQLSKASCIEGETWGSNRAGVWVNQGCRGVFSIDRRWR